MWIPWLRPGFELGRLIRNAVQQNPKADGIVLGGHGLFTWGETQRACYENTLTVIDDLGEFVLGYVEKAGDSLFGGTQFAPRADRQRLAIELLPAPKEFLDMDHSELHLSGHMPQRINSVLNLSGHAPLPEDSEAAPEFANSIFHSLAARYTEVLRMISDVSGKKFRNVYIVGGGNRNTFLNQLLQERSGLEVIRGPVECSTIGNAAIQLAVLEGRTGSSFGVSRDAVAEWSHRLAALEG